MAINTVTVNINNLVLTNGHVYQSGATAILSDEEFCMLAPTMFTNSSPHLTLVTEDTPR
jgi:hypothetical protein